ncbi:MAG TPA: TAT-variant-translocated molybdopterin oxidoreductase [Acidobacteriaceae bacterium]
MSAEGFETKMTKRSEEGHPFVQVDGPDETAVGAAGGLTLDQLRTRGSAAKHFWRSAEELAETPEFGQMLEREFPLQASEWIDPVTRRGFMKLAGASLALAGLAGCTKQPDEAIYPYVKAPEDLVLGRPMYFATAHPFPTGAVPLVVKSDAFRPIKVDGNPEHPVTRGASDAITQGTLLGLYDPDRAQRISYRGETREWAAFLEQFQSMLAIKKSGGGAGLYFLSETVTSPTLAAQWKKAQAGYPQAKFVQWEPVNRDSARAASRQGLGGDYDAQYRLDQADVILSLDADFLSGITHPGFHRLAGDYARRRKLDQGPGSSMNRMYAVESMTTTTGLKAEHRLPMNAALVAPFAWALAAELGAPGAAAGGAGWTAAQQKFLAAVAKDMKAAGASAVAIPGEQQSVAVHLAAMAINQALGAVGKTVVYTETVNPMPSIQGEDLKSLVADMNAGRVDWLVILETNPVYAAPVDLNFDAALKKVRTIATLSAYPDETAAVSEWHIHSAHYLESWSDARAYDGTVTIVQPMIAPLYEGKQPHHILQAMLEEPLLSAYDAVRGTWPQFGGAAGDAAWRKALHDGFLANTAFAAKSVSARPVSTAFAQAGKPSASSVTVVFRADYGVYDGRYANIAWMQEIPRPVTNLSWDNAAMVSHRTLDALQLEEGDLIEITVPAQGQAHGYQLLAPVLAVPGHADGQVTLTLGQGRSVVGRVGIGHGYNAAAVRTSGSPLMVEATVRRTGERAEFAVTKSHYIDHRGHAAGGDGSGTHSLEANEAEVRGIIRYATLGEYRKDPEFAQEGEGRDTPEPTTSMFPAYRYDANAWGMSIDLNSCVGCNACVVSCYAENNIPAIGKHQVKVGRNMQWIRIDSYYEGDLATPRAHFQPMLCQHCENAPCEQVCPVGATVHTPEGLNTMVYNRCVGTRYCSNNCPYKVRRFNFLLYSDYETESLKFMRNPDVTVRSRGVMEKCSYCVQRINAAKIEADKDNREIRDGEIVTACQQACPTDAITFGNINDKGSKVRRLKEQARSYGVLADLNTRPRTTYMAGVLNVNEELGEG